MFDKLLDGLANQGAMGALLGVLLLLFVRFFNRTFDAQVERDRASASFMRECLAALTEIKVACMSCRNEIVSIATTRVREAEERIVDAIWNASDKAIAETRRDNDLSRPHPVTPPPAPVQPYPPVPGVRFGTPR